MTVADPPRFVRADGPDKVTGSGRYTADLTLTGMLHAKFLYAGVPHARITKLDTDAAREIPGVLAVITADDVPDVRYEAPLADRTLFANDVVRFEGEVVAAVAAMTPEAAQAAVEAIVVEYDPLPVVVDVEAAMEPSSPLVHPDWDSYETEGMVAGHNVASFSSIAKGDADAAMADADTVVKRRYVADSCHAAPIEPRAVVAQWEGDKVTIWSATQVPFAAHSGVCATLGLPESHVRIIVPHLGGGFGGKCGFHFEAHVAALAKASGRPVKLVFSREEEFRAPDRRREGMIVDLETGLSADGSIVARRAEIWIDNGAYTADAYFFPQLAAMHVAGPYRIPDLEVKAHLVYTNAQPSGSVRAPTAPQACWALETHTDELAAAAGMDPIDFRRHNALTDGDEGAAGQVYGEIGLQRCMESAVERASARGGPLGDDEAIGVALGWWPSFPSASGAYLKLNPDGTGRIITGAQECGTGAVMTLRQLAADELGMQPEDFQLVYQDTGACPYDMGATGSQTLLNNGRAVLEGAQEIGRQLKDLAADALEAAAADIVLAEGKAHVAGSADRSVTIAELAATAAGGELLLAAGSGTPPEYPSVPATCVGDHGVAGWAGPQFSCHAVRVRVDRDTGVVRVVDVAAAHDSGTIINPIGAHGQVEGGILMGIGQALTEGTRYDDQAQQRNAGLLEYKLQTAADAPTIDTDFIQIPDPNAGPHGAKGLAEAPNVPTAAAISNAIKNVIGTPVRQLPMTAERVWLAGQEVDR